jgi:predicted nucleic acid-binding protein
VRAVLDTNVIAYLLLGTKPFAAEVARVWSLVREPIAPASWEAELTNVLWMAVRAGRIDVEGALLRLTVVQLLDIQSFPCRPLWHGSLVRAAQSGLAAYDSLFVELAHREAVPLVTYDQKVLVSFPAIAVRPDTFSARFTVP